LVVLLVCCAVADVRADNFKSELLRILADHPLIKSAGARKSASLGLVQEAEGRFWPQVRGESSTGPQSRSDPSRRELERPEAFERRFDSASLVITQSIFSGYDNQKRLAASKQQVQSDDANLEKVRQQILLEGITVYLQVLLNRKLIGIALQNEKNIQEQAKLEHERVVRGSGITLDVLQAKSRLAIGKQARLTFEGDFRKARASYLQVFGAEANVANMKDPEPPAGMVPVSLEEALTLSRAHNPSVMEFEFFARGLANIRDAERAGFWPKVDAVGTLEYKANEGTTAGHERSATLLFRGTWDIFNGFSTRGRVESAARTYQNIQFQTANQRRKVDEEVRLTWEELVKQKQRLAVLKNAVDIQAEVFEQRKILREQGKETNLNVLDAKTELFEAQLELIKADFEFRNAAFSLGKAVGLLNPSTLGLSNP
jgi:outer membrane protein, adhesin transport system